MSTFWSRRGQLMMIIHSLNFCIGLVRAKRRWTDDLVDWCNKDICTLHGMAMDGTNWSHFVKYVMDTNGHWAHGTRERERNWVKIIERIELNICFSVYSLIVVSPVTCDLLLYPCAAVLNLNLTAHWKRQVTIKWMKKRMSRNTAPSPRIGIFWVLKQSCFRHTFSQCVFIAAK